MGVEEIIDEKIKTKKVVVISKSWCGYSSMAKQALKKYVGKELSDADYEIWDIDDEPDADAIQNYLAKITGARTVPRVFINGKCIGGGSETQTADKNGQLKKMLTAI